MNKLTKFLTIALLITGTVCSSQAQDDSRIKIKITKEVDGKKEIFEREYASADEMRGDEEYQVFSGDDNDFDFQFDMDGVHEQIIELHEGNGAHAFSFSFNDDKGPHKRLKRQHFGGRVENSFWLDDENAVVDFRPFDLEEYEEELEEKMEVLKERIKELDENLQEDILESMKEIEEMSSGIFPKKIRRGGISIEDVGDDFGSRGKVNDKDMLDLDDMDFMIKNNRLTLKFRVEEPGELTFKISNEKGKDIYNRYFEKFGGTFSESIDFSKYSDGKYLLEISKDKKRLTKKIVID